MRNTKSNKKKIYNLIILDESGSMQTIKQATIKGFNELASNIKETSQSYKDQEHYVSVISFNCSGVKYRLYNQPVEELMLFDDRLFEPMGLTPLYDEIGESILKLKHDLLKEENYNVLVTVITDGYENDSKEFNSNSISHLIQSFSENPNWVFGLIGANIDVTSLAELLSIPTKRTISFAAEDEGVNTMFSRYSRAQDNLCSMVDNVDDLSDLPF